MSRTPRAFHMDGRAAADATGAHVLGDAITRLERSGIAVLLSGVASAHDEVLTSLGIGVPLVKPDGSWRTRRAAIVTARQLLADPH